MLRSIKSKKSKIKRTRRRVACIVLLSLLLILFYAIFHVRNYEKTYEQNGFQIKESYHKKEKSYTFEITKEEKAWSFVVEHKYQTKKKLINEINLVENDSASCIIPKSGKLTIYPQCLKENELIDFHLVEESLKEQIGLEYFKTEETKKESFEKIDIKSLDDNTYYIWNYKGFYKINKEDKKTISLFEKDIYNIVNVAQVKNYLLIPDYDASYYFNKFYIINMKNGKTNTWDIKDSIYFDGYYLGSHKNSLFYVDKKTKIEWEIVPKKKKMRKVGTEEKDGKILKNGEWEKISLNKLVNNTISFEEAKKYHYEIAEGLYRIYNVSNVKVKISNKEVKEIITEKDGKVYYIAGDSLYYYSIETGEVEIMSYFEWNFNYKNMIFIY